AGRGGGADVVGRVFGTNDGTQVGVFGFAGATDHDGGQLFSVGIGLIDRGHMQAVAHHRHPVTYAHGFADLVGDEDDAHALIDHGADRLEQRVDFLWRQVGGRLVQDQDF